MQTNNRLKELSLHILDIAENSIKAGASLVSIYINETYKNNFLLITIKDNGDGILKSMLSELNDFSMISKKISEKISEKTLKKNRCGGMGLLLLKNAVKQCNGSFSINSILGKGVYVRASFVRENINLVPIGDMASLIIVLLICSPDTDFNYTHIIDNKKFVFDTRDIRTQIDDVSITNPSILGQIKRHIKESLIEIGKGEVK